jgi:hypothetical protein
MIYNPCRQFFYIRRDITLNESASFNKSKLNYAKEVHEEENEVTRVP